MLRDKRATRGLRMADLVGQAAEDDDQFWNADVWNEEGSDQDSFSEEEVKPDEFDEDFNDTETEDEEGSDEDAKVQKAGKSEAMKEKKSSNVYKDPSLNKRASSGAGGKEIKRPRLDPEPHSSLSLGKVRTVRDSTKAKTSDMESVIQGRDRAVRKGKPYRKLLPTQFVQKELLREALDTEEENARWLVAQRVVDTERAMSDRPAKKEGGSFTRFLSRRGTHDTITFSSVDAVPEILRPDRQVQVLPDKICVITGLPARYRDPLTGQPYANLAAFKKLRERQRRGTIGTIPR